MSTGQSRKDFEEWFKTKKIEMMRSGASLLSIKKLHKNDWEAWQASRAALVQPEKQPKLIGWRTADYTDETTSPAMAKNWAAAVGVIPIFEGDINTKITQQPE